MANFTGWNNKNVLREVMYLVEAANGDAMVVLDGRFAERLTLDEQRVCTVSLLTLGLNIIAAEAESVPDDLLVEVSPDPTHSELVLALRFVEDLDGNVGVFTHFGGLVDPNTSLRSGLVHALEVLSSLKGQL